MMNKQNLSDRMQNSRRTFIKQNTLAAAGLAMLPDFFSDVRAQTINNNPFVGIQLGTHSLLAEGIDWVLDLLQEKGEINTIITYSHSYYGAANRPDSVLADHGKGIISYKNRNFPKVWVNHNNEYFNGLLLKHEKPDRKYDFYGRDAFSEMRRPLDKRGMKVYVRLFEPWAADGIDHIENYEKVLTEDIDGKPGKGPCWNNPDYQAWIFATVKDVFANYQIDGIQYGAERVGPLSELLFKNEKPNCFCEHCTKKNVAAGIDPERARAGFSEIRDLINKAFANEIPQDGVFISLMNIVFRYPEVLSWERNFYDGGEEINKGIYKEIKAINPAIEVGRHVDHQQSSWDPIYRAMVPYSSMAGYNDFIKPILYHDILAIRLRYWYINRISELVGRDFTENELLSGFYGMMRFHPAARIPLEELEESSMPPEYVGRETQRCVAGVGKKCKVYAGVGFDVPWHLPEGGIAPRPSDPGLVYETVISALKAGADGLVASRDYDEMQNKNIEAFGRAVRDWKKA
jgi:hypothetical protein